MHMHIKEIKEYLEKPHKLCHKAIILPTDFKSFQFMKKLAHSLNYSHVVVIEDNFDESDINHIPNFSHTLFLLTGAERLPQKIIDQVTRKAISCRGAVLIQSNDMYQYRNILSPNAHYSLLEAFSQIPTEPILKKECTCDSLNLFRFGCRCKRR